GRMPRVIDGKTETDVRTFVLSRKLSPQALLETARGHWGIENRLHWQLDVSFGEDAARNRKDNGPANIAVIRRRALDVARLDKSKGSLTEKLNSSSIPHRARFPLARKGQGNFYRPRFCLHGDLVDQLTSAKLQIIGYRQHRECRSGLRN